MKSIFNKNWGSSVQPRKQIKFRLNSPNHIRRKFMSSPLNKSLKQKYGINSIEVRKGDEVKVMRGKFSKKQGKVSLVDIKNTRVQVAGIQRQKTGGEKLETWFHPSKIMIIELDTNDKRRLKRIKNTETKKENKQSLKEEK